MSPVIRQQLPNSLTVLRVVLAAAFFASLNLYRYPDLRLDWANIAIGFFIAAAITDALDGYLARKWHVESIFGRIMDPFCDKVLILGAFMYLTGPRFAYEPQVDGEPVIYMATAVYPWMVVVILARELLVTGIRGVVESEGVSFASKWSGKAKMILQCIAIPVILFLTVNFQPSENAWALHACEVLAYATVIVTVWSGFPYIFGLRKMLVERSIRAAADT
jgi:CDP-diacylglycerol--glycerol-3-phosphate 3-phosphatidyltransferase